MSDHPPDGLAYWERIENVTLRLRVKIKQKKFNGDFTDVKVPVLQRQCLLLAGKKQPSAPLSFTSLYRGTVPFAQSFARILKPHLSTDVVESSD